MKKAFWGLCTAAAFVAVVVVTAVTILGIIERKIDIVVGLAASTAYMGGVLLCTLILELWRVRWHHRS